MSAWLNKVFKAGQVNKGGVVRRSVTSVKKYASIKELQNEVRIRRFHLLRMGDQYVIVCNGGYLRLIC